MVGYARARKDLHQLLALIQFHLHLQDSQSRGLERAMKGQQDQKHSPGSTTVFSSLAEQKPHFLQSL